MHLSIQGLADLVGARVVCGDACTQVSGVAQVEAATAADLVFVERREDLADALASNAAAVIAGDFAAGVRSAKAVLVASNPRLAFIRAASRICPPVRREPGVHPSAVVHDSVRLGCDVAVADRATLERNVRIGDRTQVASGVVIGEDCVIGNDCDIRPNAVIYAGTRLGDRVVVHAGAVLGSDGFGFVPDPATGRYEKFPQVGWLEVGDDVEIGANVTIDRGALGATVISAGTKFDNLVHIGHNVQVGRDVVMAAQVGIAGSSFVGDGAMLGGQVGIGDHARVEDGVILGGQTGVPSQKVVRGKGIVFWGTPARPLRDCLRELAALARLARKRP